MGKEVGGFCWLAKREDDRGRKERIQQKRRVRREGEEGEEGE